MPDTEFTHGAGMACPVDQRTPLEAIAGGCALSILSYTKVCRTFVESSYEEVDDEKMLQKFGRASARLATLGPKGKLGLLYRGDS